MGLLLPGLKVDVRLELADQKKLTAMTRYMSKKFEIDFRKLLDLEARLAYDRMIKDSPYRTGLLREGIKLTNSGKNIIFESKAIDPDTHQDYAPDQDLPPGTLDIKTTPYFAKNIRRMKRDFENQIKGVFKGFARYGEGFKLGK